MKHIKSIITIAVISCIAGFVIWQLTWMRNLKSEFTIKKKTTGTEQNEYVHADKVPRKGMVKEETKIIENKGMAIVKEETPIVEKTASQTEPLEIIPEKKELLEPRPVISGTQLPREIKKLPPAKRPAYIAAESNHADADSETVNPQLKHDKDNTKIITIKGTSEKTFRSLPDKSAPQINMSAVTQHSTSTVPH